MNFEKVREVIADTISIDEERIVPEASLKEDLQIDSLDAMEISLALEEAFQTEIPTEELGKFVTIRDIMNYLEKNA